MRLVTGRRPSPSETDRLERLLATSLAGWRDRPEEIEAFTGATTDATVAAWVQVARALLNLHEAVYRD